MKLKKAKLLALYYHDRFDYPLTRTDLVRWECRGEVQGSVPCNDVEYKDGYYFLKGREKIIKIRKSREAASEGKLIIAKRVAKILAIIPTLKMVGVTGSLAMKNAGFGSDIDLIFITEKDTLWLSRLLTYFVLKLAGLPIRKPGKRVEKDRFCLNMWLDESDLVWSKDDRNAFTAHEIAQIVPLINKEKTYEHFLRQNKWILEYWPKSVKIQNPESEIRNGNSSFMLRASNFIAFYMQYWYMKRKITNEIVILTRAIFHPNKIKISQ